MTTAVLPEPILTIPALTPLGKAARQVVAMEQIRDRKVPRWLDVQAFIAPYSSNVQQADLAYERNAENVLEGSIFFNRNTLGSFFATAMTNPSRIWSEWEFANPLLKESEAAKEFAYELNTRRFQLLARSNFYPTMDWVYEEWPTFATAVVLIEEDEEDVFRYVPFPIGSYALADDHKGRCCAVSRRFAMTVRQVVERFATKPDGTVDREKLSLRTKALVDNENYEAQIEIAHLVCPNDDFNPVKQTPDSWKYASLYWEWGATAGLGPNDGFLAREGYREWPFMVYRWKRIAGDPFGVDSPGIATLAEVKSAQQMESDKLMGIEKLVKPPTVAPTSAGFISLLPAAQNKVDTRTGNQVGPIHEVPPLGIQLVGEEQDKIAERIGRLRYTSLILALTATEGAGGRERTATEIREIGTEKLLVLGRAVEAAHEALTTASEREYAIMARRGFLPPIPPELEGEPLLIKYTSMLALAQRSVGLNTSREYGLVIAEMAKLTGDPDILIRTDWSEWAQDIGDKFGVNPKVQRSDEEVAAIRQAQAQAQAEERQAMVAEQEAKAAKTLSETSMEGDTALTALQGAAQGTV